MTTKTKAPVREGVSKAKAPVREGLAFLIEDALERSEVVIAAESIVDKLQSIAEDLSTIEAKEIMPLLDSMTNAFGPDVAQSFNGVATEQVRQLITAVQGAKTAMDNEILRLKQGVEGGDMSDMGMDAGAKPMMPGAPDAGMGEPAGGEGPPAGGALPDMAAPDVGGNAEDDQLARGGNFAGRDKKIESRKAKGKKIAEDIGVPHSHESVNLDANIHNLAQYYPQAGRLAQQIRGMIRSEELSGADRKALAEVLSHVTGFGTQPSHWAGVNADKKLEMCLQSAGIWKVDGNVEKIVSDLKRLAHLLSMHHDGVLESNIALLRKAADPDAVILKMFRTKLAEHKDAQMAAIRCAGAFAIDVEDVVAVVKEAASRRPFPPKLTEFKADINPAKKGMFKGKNASEIRADLAKQKKRSKAAQDRGEKVPDEVKTKEREDAFAIRAKTGWGKVSEDTPPLMQGVPMFPIEQGTAASSITKNPMDAPTNSQPQASPSPTFAPGPPVAGNSAPSATGAPTNAPQSPATMRARQNAQQQQTAVQKKAAQQPNNNQNPPPPNGQKPKPPYTPPGEDNAAQPAQKQRGFMQK